MIEGRSARETAKLFGVSVASVVKWQLRMKPTGTAAQLQMVSYRKRVSLGEKDCLLGRPAERPDLTVRALADELAERGIVVSHNTVWTMMRASGLSSKKGLFAIEQLLVPTLAAGDVVILDNLGRHKGGAARKAIRAVGASIFFLPSYSPGLNPIEQVFAKLKCLLQKAEECSLDALCNRLGSLLDAFPPHECATYLRNSGYASNER